MSNTGVEILGYLAGGLTTVCLLPQLIQVIYTESNAKDISVPTYVCLVVGQILWVAYGILMTDLRVILANIISCVLAISIIVIVLSKRINYTTLITQP